MDWDLVILGDNGRALAPSWLIGLGVKVSLIEGDVRDLNDDVIDVALCDKTSV